jgi:hypothetical protein
MSAMATVWIIIAVVCGVIALVGYFAGVRKGAAWGQAVVVLFTLLAVAAIIARTAKVGTRIRVEPYASMRLIGEGLKGQLKDGAKVFIFREPMLPEEGMGGPMMPPPPPPEGGPGMPAMPSFEEMVKQNEAGWKKALEKGAGVSVQIVGSGPPASQYPGMFEFAGNAQEFSKTLDKYPDIDCWISLVGLPRNMTSGEWELEKVTTYQRAKAPIVAARVGLFYDPAKLRQWLQDGKLAAIVLMPEMGKPTEKVFTKANINELPTQAPNTGMPMPGMMPPGGQPAPAPAE